MRRATLLSAACLLALWGPAQARDITGSLTYPERIALPPGAEVTLELRDATGAVVASDRFATEGRQVPLDFTLTAPDGPELLLQAAVFDGAQPLRKTPAVTVPAGTDDVALGALRLEPHVAMGFATRLRCGTEEVTVGFLGPMARLETADGLRDLTAVPAASGARYEAVDDPDTWLWSRGQAATVSLDGRLLPGCLPAEAVPPLPFRALGHEPAWHLDLDDTTLALTLDFGAQEVTRPAPAPQLLPEGVLYGADDIELRLTRALCRDIATGMPHPFTVRVAHGDAVLRGCGGAPESLLTASTWQVTEIDGAPPGQTQRPLILRLAEGRLAIDAPCNQMAGGYELTGEGLRLGPMAATMMLCPDPVMQTEAALAAALDGIDRFDITEDGALALIAADRPRLLALPVPAP